MDPMSEPCIVVIFGATGDLTRRKLIPAFYNLHHDGLLPKNFAICAYARRPSDDATYRNELKESVQKHSRQPPGADWPGLAERVFYVNGALDDDAGYKRLKEKLAEIDKQLGTAGNRLYYLALGSEFFIELVEKLHANDLIASSKQRAPWTRVVFEKPIGRDPESARTLLAKSAEFLAEEQIFRIDHYLGKETVQNILAMRFGNCIFEPVWNRKYVDHVQISVAESEGVGSRAGYYDHSGALRDLVQNHMLQLLCLVAMEAPGTMSADDVRNEKVKVLHNLRKMPLQDIAKHTVRGQYGPSPDGKAPGYRSEKDVDPNSNTETFVALRCFVDTWRWAGVPFILRTGKKLPRRESEISIHFRMPPLQLFEDVPPEISQSCIGNVLAVSIQPNEGLNLELATKVPGTRMQLQNVKMNLTYAETFKRQSPDAYERLLLDAMLGDATLFTRDDEVLAQWAFTGMIQSAWQSIPPPQFPNYPAGTWGPPDAAKLVPVCSPGWHLK